MHEPNEFPSNDRCFPWNNYNVPLRLLRGALFFFFAIDLKLQQHHCCINSILHSIYRYYIGIPAKNNSNLLSKAKEINEKLLPLHKSLFIESSPSPVKYAASLLNLSSEDVRLPLVKITDETKKEVKSAMSYADLI